MKTAEECYWEVVDRYEKYTYSDFHLKIEQNIEAMELYANQFKSNQISELCDTIKSTFVEVEYISTQEYLDGDYVYSAIFKGISEKLKHIYTELEKHRIK